MKKISVDVETNIEIEFDENSNEFKNAFEAFKKIIDSNATYNSYAEFIARIIARDGLYDMIEGVGNPKINGDAQYKIKDGKKEFINHPVNVIVSTHCGLVDFETYIRQV